MSNSKYANVVLIPLAELQVIKIKNVWKKSP